MKKLLLGMSLLCLLQTNSFGQFQIHPDSSFYTFLDSFHFYHQDDSAEGGLYNRVRRDAMTWGPRLAPTGNMSVATNAIVNYTEIYKASVPLPSPSSSSTTLVVFPAAHPLSPPWTELGPTKPVVGANSGKGMGQVHRLAFHPSYGLSNQTIYAGSHYGGLYRTDDAGANWYNYGTDRGLSITSISGIATSADKVFVCTGNGDHGYADFGQNANYSSLSGPMNNANPIHTQGVYYSSHAAPNWVLMNGSTTDIYGNPFPSLLDIFANGGTMRNIIVDPNNPNILFIATSKGIFRSDTQGNSWQQVLVGPSNGMGGYFVDSEWRGLEFHPSNPNIVYASGKEIYQSTDGGLTWIPLTGVGTNLDFSNPPFSVITPSRINLAVTPAASHLLYAFLVKSDNISLVVYDTASMVWRHLHSDLNGAGQNTFEPQYMGVAVSPLDSNLIFYGGTKVKGSSTAFQGGFGYKSPYNAPSFHADVHELKFPPNVDSILFATTHGGVNKKLTSNTGAGGWTALYNGLGVATIWAFDDWEGNDSIMITANQDVGINHSLDFGNLWMSRYGNFGDGYGVRVDDQTGKAYVKGNDYQGIFDLTQNLERIKPYPGTGYYVVYPRDIMYAPSQNALIPSTFPMINHPKTDIGYLGFSELYVRKNCTLPEGLIDTVITIDTMTTIINDTFKLRGTRIDSFGNLHPLFYPPPFFQTCSDLGGVFIDTIQIHLGSNNTYVIRIDTLCYYYDSSTTINTIINTSPQVSFDSVRQYLWQNKSDLKLHKPNIYNRRIMEIAFSEDENTDYTYLATLGDNTVNGYRRSDFYVNDASVGCDTCFILKTDSLPIDSSSINPSLFIADVNPITGIAVDPLDGNRVWVSFSGYSKAIKVWYSDDAGAHWVTYDDANNALANLNMPINHIVYQRGTNDRLYIATDVGVYVCEDLLNGGTWLRYGDEFPNVRTTELKINYCTGKLRAATFGRGLWEADLLPPVDEVNLRSFRLIASNEVWNTDKNMSRDIKIDSGATLTLDNITLNMPKGGLIVIEQGGELIVNGSTITNLCNETWEGIEVWGNSSLAQTPTTNQGVLRLNNATISYAKDAVRAWHVGFYPDITGSTGQTGGLILANNSQFINNWRSVELMRYIAPNGSRELSSFKECVFKVDSSYRDFGGNVGKSFLGHVSMWDVGGTQIRGCTFQDERSNKLSDPQSEGSFGVGTLGASPHLVPQPIGGTFPPSGYIRNTFEGIERAVELTNPAQTTFISIVDQVDFVDNEQGVIVRGQNNVQVTRNDFQIGGFDSQGNSTSSVEEYGLGIITATGFSVEQNDFRSTNTTDPIAGSWIEDIGTDGNKIRNNSYTDLIGANLAHGYNDDPFIPQDGIQYLCNQNQGNSFDFIVFPNANTTNADASVGNNQGDITQGNRNTLSVPIQPMPYQSQFFNSSYNNGLLNAPLTYYYYGNAPSEIPNTALLFNVDDQNVPLIGDLDFCENKYANPSGPLVTNKNGAFLTLTKMKKKYYKVSNRYTKLKEKYQKLLDKGNSDSLKIAINNTSPQNKNALKDSLMSISPFLSKEVLLTVVDCGLFNRNKLKKLSKKTLMLFKNLILCAYWILAIRP